MDYQTLELTDTTEKVEGCNNSTKKTTKNKKELRVPLNKPMSM